MHVRTVGATASADRAFDCSGIAFVLASAPLTGALRTPRRNALSGPLSIAEIADDDDLVELSVELDKGVWLIFHNRTGYLGTRRRGTRRARAISDRISPAEIDAELAGQVIQWGAFARSRTFTHDRSDAFFFAAQVFEPSIDQLELDRCKAEVLQKFADNEL